jgi:hypothetical protein
VASHRQVLLDQPQCRRVDRNETDLVALSLDADRADVMTWNRLTAPSTQLTDAFDRRDLMNVRLQHGS